MKSSEVVRAAGFGVGAAHVEAAEGMRADHGAGALAIEVEIADVELVAGAVELLAGAGVDGAGEAVLGVVGDGEGVVEAVGLDDGEDGAEDLFLREAGGGSDVGEDGGGDVEAAVRCVDGGAAGEQAAFGFADVDVVEHALVGDCVDDGAGVEVLGGVAGLMASTRSLRRSQKMS